MSYSQQFEDDSAMGCVCDFDVSCPAHPSTDCGSCEYACHCSKHNYRHSECSCADAPARTAVLKRPAHATYRKAWIADWRVNTGEPRWIAEVRFEQMIGQSWDGCRCPACKRVLSEIT